MARVEGDGRVTMEALDGAAFELGILEETRTDLCACLRP